ncbi:MAG TPA: xanthine dehydrogenase family protein subunit M [Stenotrophomonas sp.]|nr:xanthine dehydrogenase family protein subunit M [Stenotrophomonas sp.]
MNPFRFETSASVDDTLQRLARSPGEGTARVVAGGTNLLDLMKLLISPVQRVIDINALPLQEITELPGGGLRLGATARNADTAYHPHVRKRFPLLSAAILAGASPQIRNMASNAGNLLQRTRCTYFYDPGVPCNKRQPGSGCPAIGGLTKYHAILGASPHCIATHPSDMCVALAALDATVVVTSTRGERRIAFDQFHRLPGDAPERDTHLEEDELILAIELPPADAFVAHSAYIKIRERLSYAFALVSVAAALALDEDGRILAARIALGGVAHKPWRDTAAEASLVGARCEAGAFDAAAGQLLKQAVPQGQNAFKIPLARRAIVHALQTAAQGTVDNHGDHREPGR